MKENKSFDFVFEYTKGSQKHLKTDEYHKDQKRHPKIA